MKWFWRGFAGGFGYLASRFVYGCVLLCILAACVFICAGIPTYTRWITGG